ncbi:hypothetical protein [Couchioplanes caeruleus]|uniref:Uncharacterized protein n=1 Tax=Couchioplanes caeruleus subsp. caeruleus TaxID=56427 RepID=A0A1K0G4K5_9ACTN|nr:hypothetical protein [Couchioplanes caeruleus]OJF12218.1 hypothetical protein BG844_21740 [Couchioplanes caeruleus subsp. caeruleus]
MSEHEPRWYDEIPSRGMWRIRRRDKLEFAIAALLLTGLLGLLVFGVSRESPQPPRPNPASSSGVTLPVDSPAS